jgi:hypothetical protein
MASSSDCPVPPPHCEAYRRVVEMAASGFRAGRVVFRLENPHPAIFGVGEALYAVSWAAGRVFVLAAFRRDTLELVHLSIISPYHTPN